MPQDDDLGGRIRAEGDGPTDRLALAERIRERMEILNLNPFSAAKKAGLGQDFVRDILRGKVKQPSGARLAKLAEALETSLFYLLGKKEIDPGNQTAPGVHEIPPAPYPATLESTEKEALLLPIRYELMADAFRKSTDVMRAPLGYEAATIPPAYRGRRSWWELLRDESMTPYVPVGALCQVVEYADHERAAVEDGDIIVIQKRLVEQENASYHFLERSLRVVSHRYPDLGLWFMEYGNEDWGISDDVLREDEAVKERRAAAARKGGGLPQVMRDTDADPPPGIDYSQWRLELPSKPGKQITHDDLDPEGLWKIGLEPGFIQRVEKAMAGAKHIDDLLGDPDRMEKLLEASRKRAPKLVGKVIRILVPVDPRAKFGIGPD